MEKIFLVAMRPAQAHEVVQQRVRQVTHLAVLHDVGRAGALGQLGAFGVQDHRQVREMRHGGAERTVDVDLPRRVVDVVVAAHDVGDAHVQVVDDHGEVVGRVTVGAEDHQVVQLAVGELDRALDLVVPAHHAVDGVLETDHAVRIVAEALVAIAIRAVVARLVAGGHGLLAHGFEFFLRLVGVVRGAGGDHLLGDRAVTLQALRLVDRAFVVGQAQPLHRLQDRVDGRLRAAFAIGVLDAQDELAAATARLQPAVQRRAGAADVQVAGGTGGETGAAAHAGDSERRKRAILPERARCGRIRRARP
ncbi:hypothetical protein ABIE51_001231 [Lysobacter sp. OAE881]